MAKPVYEIKLLRGGIVLFVLRQKPVYENKVREGIKLFLFVLLSIVMAKACS
jgi:hypothetical protein